MKSFLRITTTLLFTTIVYLVNAQGINFQGVARSANGTIIASSNIGLKLSIISKNVDATPEFVETKTVVTNAQGIFSIVIGDSNNKSIIGVFKNIDWANAPKFLKVEMDPSGGVNYINMGATQLQYVPYSFYSLGVAAGNVIGILPLEKGGTGVGSLVELKSLIVGDFVKKDSGIFTKDISVNGHLIGRGKNSIASNIAIGSNALNQNTTGANNTGVGGDALKSNTTGYQNVAIGNQALSLNTTGDNNNAFGYVSQQKTTTGRANSSFGSESMRENTTGSYNAGFGNGSLWKNTTGSNNSALGYQSLQYNTTGYNNTAVGQASLFSTTEGPNNVAIGVYALNKNIVGSRNVAIGVGALQENLGSVNNAVGYISMNANTTGDANNAFGHAAMNSNTTGTENAAFGHNTSQLNQTGNRNTAMGYNGLQANLVSDNSTFGWRSLQANTTGTENAAFGEEALTVNTTGSYVSAFGAEAGKANSSGSYNTYLGANANTTSGTISNSTAIGYNAQVTASNQIQLGNADVTMVKSAGVLTSSRGLLPPKFSAAQRDAIVDPEQGLMIYCTNCGSYGELEVFNGITWVTASGSATSAVITDITNGLVASFELDGSPSGTITATTTNGTVTYTTNRKGIANSAMQGGAGYITAPSSIFQFTRTQGFTVSVWFTADAVASSGRLLSTENAEGNFRIGKYDLNTVAIQYGDYITQTVTNNDWHHLVYTYNNRLEKVYMDGVLVQTNTDASTEALNYGAPFTIGAKAASAFDKWAGKIDDIKIYNRAILSSEVQVLFNQ